MDNSIAFDYAMFCRAALSWVYDGTPKYKVFKKDRGLCRNLHWWCYHHRVDAAALVKYQKRLFIKAGLDPSFPFNNGDAIPTLEYSYYQELEKGTAYDNPRRIAWLVKHRDVRNH